MNVVLGLKEAAVEFVWWWSGVVGLYSHFRVKPNCSVEVEVVVVTIMKFLGFKYL